MQKAPQKCGNDDGDPRRLRELFEKGNGEKAKREFFVSRSEQADRRSGDPRKKCVHRLFVVEFLRSPCAEARRDHVKGDDVANVSRGKRKPDDRGREKFL